MSLVRTPEARVVLAAVPPARAGGGLLLRSLTALAGILVVFFGGMLVGRAVEPAPVVVLDEARPSVAPVTVAGAGATRVANGVPVGYPRTKDGAVAAATNYYLVLSSPLILDDAKRREAIATLAAPQAAAALKRQYDQAAPRLRRMLAVEEGAQVLLRSVPIGFRVDRFDDSTAEVTIWAAGLVGSSAQAGGTGAPVRENWGVSTITLAWVEGDWKQVRLREQRPLVPLAGGQAPSPAEELVTQARTFQEYRHGA